MIASRIAAAAFAALLPALPAAADAPGWGRDLLPGQAAKVEEEARAGLVRVLKASPVERTAAVAEFLRTARATTEGWKRFRNPELRPAFLALLDEVDWHQAHRALLVLERMPDRDGKALAGAWSLLHHSERRMREKAAISCILLWNEAAAKGLSQGDFRNALASLLDGEKDPPARRAMEALRLRMDGKLPLQRVHEEPVVKDPDGLLRVPFLDGMDRAKAVAPEWTPKQVSQQGGASAAKGPVAAAWAAPLLDWGVEEVRGTLLQPFGNTREGGRVHTGLDIGACLDGAGYYALGDGIVRLVHAGSDMGTLLVLEHRVADDELLCSVYMHGTGTVFVRAGDRVEAGRLLGSMGMGFSPENGGHAAHLHLGLYPGPFRMEHNYGYKQRADGIADWLDPARWVPRLCDGSLPGTGEDPKEVVARAERLRKSGFPARAQAVLESGAKALQAAEIAGALAAWKRDAIHAKALKGEPAVARAEAAVRAAAAEDLDAARAALKALLPEYGETVLAGRIRESL